MSQNGMLPNLPTKAIIKQQLENSEKLTLLRLPTVHDRNTSIRKVEWVDI